MKKLLMAAAPIALTATMAVSMAGCAAKERMKVIDVMLTGEEYAYAINKNKSEDWVKQVNDVLEKLVGSKPYNPELDATTDAVGVSYDYDGDGVEEENVTIKTLYDAEVADTEENDTIADNIGVAGTDFITSVDDIKSGERDQYFVVATNAEFAPWEDMDGNSFRGVDMHVAKIIAEAMGLKLCIVNMEFDVVIQNVNQGKADIGMAGLTYNPTRAEMVNFSTHYYGTTQRIAVRESDAHLFADCKNEADVRKVITEMGNINGGAADGQSGYAYLAGDTNFGEKFTGFPNVTTKGYPNISLAVQDLSVGKVRIVAADKDTLLDAVNSLNETIPVEEE